MKLITKQAAHSWAKQQLKHKDTSHLLLMSFKKDRHIKLVKQENTVTIIEAGFTNATYPNLPLQEALKLLKKLIVKEFPRSHNLYCQLEKGTSKDK